MLFRCKSPVSPQFGGLGVMRLSRDRLPRRAGASLLRRWWCRPRCMKKPAKQAGPSVEAVASGSRFFFFGWWWWFSAHPSTACPSLSTLWIGKNSHQQGQRGSSSFPFPLNSSTRWSTVELKGAIHRLTPSCLMVSPQSLVRGDFQGNSVTSFLYSFPVQTFSQSLSNVLLGAIYRFFMLQKKR